MSYFDLFMIILIDCVILSISRIRAFRECGERGQVMLTEDKQFAFDLRYVANGCF